MYKDTITLFNRKESRSGDVWYPTIIRNVDVHVDKASILAKYGPEATDKAILHIAYSAKNGIKIIAGKPWLSPKIWDAQSDHSQSITFTDGDRFDFFWLGEWEGTEPINDTDYESDFYTYMNKRHDYVFAISSVGGPYSVIPHFEIMGK